MPLRFAFRLVCQLRFDQLRAAIDNLVARKKGDDEIHTKLRYRQH